tara:strand:+ start:7445 stop:8413 length:969 start_codon:yes stop_codon:yes gene_type:complete
MKESKSSFLVAAIIAAGALISSTLSGQSADIPPPATETAPVAEVPKPEPADPVVESSSPSSVEPPSESDEEEVTVTETEDVVQSSGGTMVAEEETVTVAPPKKKDPVPLKKKDSFYDKYLHDRLTLGTRVLWYSLTDTESGEEFDGSFIGSLNRTTEDQNPAPIYFYAEYAITPYFGFGMSYDQFKIVTLDSGGGDGSFELDGPILYGFGRFENGSAFTPFLEVGIAFYGVDFSPKDEWTYSDGGTTVINRFDVDNSTGFVLGGGLDIAIIEHLSVNLYLRYVSVDVDVDYYFTPASNTTPSASGSFPGDHFSYGLGVAYTF